MFLKKKYRLIGISVLLIFSLLWGIEYYREHKDGKVIIRVGIFSGSNWNVPAGDSYKVIDAAIKDFETKNPYVKIVYVNGIPKNEYAEWLAEQVLKGQEPDVFMVLSDDFNLYTSMGLLENLDHFIDSDKNFSCEEYYKSALDYGKYKQQQYALPFESIPTLMFVNKTLLKRERIPMPSNKWTWQDFINICRKVTKDTDGDGVIDQFGCYDYTWQQAAVTDGVKLFRDDGRYSYFADDKMKDVVKFMIALKKINHGYKVTSKDFDTGKVAFRPFTFAQYRTYKPYPWRIKKYSSFEWDCIKLPAGPSGKNISQLDTLLIGMSSRSTHKKIAWEFLKELCYEEKIQKLVLEDSEGLPVIKKVVESDTAGKIFRNSMPGDEKMNVAVVSEVMRGAAAPPKFKKYAIAMLMADNEIGKIIQGTMAFNNALNKVQKKINDFLQK
ncbi:ABC transporter substrate-binding protein [Pectinatus sottacetonis]|uniref:ABC transporter substrate-binding protein n=1 Tax=Pectinatus sottacetonis TaxID=1002795 RepID=UPI001E36FAA0|nr:extracellular solute-binding protein [Pectinatus sottacetonis]